MEAHELETIRLMLGDDGEPLPQRHLGILLYRKTERQVRRYLKGQTPIPGHVATRAHELARIKSTGKDVFTAVGLADYRPTPRQKSHTQTAQ